MAVGLATYASLGALVAFVGWAANLRPLTDWLGVGISMQPNATVAAMAGGLGVLLVALRCGGATVSLLGAICGLIGAATLLEYVFTIDFGIDTLLMFDRSWGRVGVLVPGRMGPPGALSWTLVGIALIGTRGGRRLRRVAPAIGILVSLIALTSIAGYLYGAGTLYTMPRLTTIAFQTATFVLAVGTGLAASMPSREPMRSLLDDGAAASLARRALPFIVALPMAFGFLRVRGESLGLYDTAMGSALLVVALVSMICAVVWWGARAVGTNEHTLAAANASRDRARMALHETESRVVATLESISDGFIALDTEWRITYVNGEAERVLSSSRQDLIGKVIWERFPVLLGTAVHEAMLRAVREGRVVEVEDRNGWRHRRFSNRIYPTSHGVSAYFRDVTEQRLADERAFKSEQQARTLIRFLPGGVAFVIDRDLRYVLADGEAMSSVGMRSQDFVGKTLAEALSPADAASRTPMIRQALAGTPFVHEHDTGGRSYVSRGVPLRNEVGEIYAVLVFSHDITDRKRAEIALQEADRRKDEFLAMLAHELRNPLAPVANALEVIRQARGEPALIEQACDTMDRQVRHMVRLIDDLMDVSRITRDRLELRRTRVELTSVLQHAIEASMPQLKSCRHRLRTSMPDNPIFVDGDPARLAQVFGNLLTNSVRYTEPGGDIGLDVTRDGGDVLIVVSDTGIGIPPDQLDTVFDPFVQVDQSIERRQGGLGIGLSLVRRLLALHDGSVHAESEGDGKGSRFIVRLPVSDAAPSASPDSARSVGASASSPVHRVLVVDDNRDAANSLALLLELRGHTTDVAHDGPAAIDHAERFRPDVILLDIGLPEMSGYEVCRAIRHREWAQRVRMIALTGWGQAEDRRKSAEAGFDVHLVKPVEFATLSAAMEGA